MDRDEAGFIVTDENLGTKTQGLFAAGDVRRKSLRQISTAVGDGALAAVNLEKYVLEKMGHVLKDFVIRCFLAALPSVYPRFFSSSSSLFSS